MDNDKALAALVSMLASHTSHFELSVANIPCLVGWMEKGGREHRLISGHRVTGVGIGLDYSLVLDSIRSGRSCLHIQFFIELLSQTRAPCVSSVDGPQRFTEPHERIAHHRAH